MAKTKTPSSKGASAMKPVGLLAELADQPQLVATSVVTLAVGLATRQPTLIRGGARMMLAVAARAAASGAVRHSVERTRAATLPAVDRPATSTYLADLVAGAIVGWVAEAIVSAAFDRGVIENERPGAGDGRASMAE